EFGYETANSQGGTCSSITTKVSGIDNYVVTITPEDPHCDQYFSDANWTSTKIGDTTCGQSATFVAGRQAAGGNPGSYRQVSHTYSEGGLRVAHLKSLGPIAFTWD